MLSTSAFIRSLPYFKGLDARQVEEISRQVRELSLDRGDMVFIEGDPCRGLYVVKTGRVRVFKSSPEGREQVLMIAGPGESFDVVAAFDGGANVASALAIEPSAVCMIPSERLLALVSPCPPAVEFIKLLTSRLRNVTSMVEDLSFRSVVSRLAKLLLGLAVAERGRSPIPTLTKDEMAAMVGSVRDVVSRALRDIERAGAIRIEGRRITVVDPDKLKKLS